MEQNKAEEFKTRDAGSYDDLTGQFDYFTEQLLGPLADAMVRLAALKPQDKVLDIGTGAGVVALKVASQNGREGKVYGIDLSNGMLAAAQAKAKDLGFTDRVEFVQMDAESLQFESNFFDVAVSLFALLHFPNPAAALSEMFRVIKPGGKMVVAIGSGPPLFSASGIMHRLLILPDLIRRSLGKQLVAPDLLDKMVTEQLPPGDEPEESHLAGHSKNRVESVASLVRQAGFVSLERHWEGHQTFFTEPEEFWDIQRTFSSIARKRLASADADKTAVLKQRFLELCTEMLSNGGSLVYPFAAFYIAGQKPL